VTATALCPGPTSTDFAERAGVAHANLFQSRVMAVEQVAREGFEGMLRGQVVVIPGARNRWLARLSGVAPRSLLVKITRGLNSPVK